MTAARASGRPGSPGDSAVRRSTDSAREAAKPATARTRKGSPKPEARSPKPKRSLPCSTIRLPCVPWTTPWPRAPSAWRSAISIRGARRGRRRAAHQMTPIALGSVRAPYRWEEWLVESAVIAGRERWRRLDGIAAEYRLRLKEAQREDPQSPRVRGDRTRPLEPRAPARVCPAARRRVQRVAGDRDLGGMARPARVARAACDTAAACRTARARRAAAHGRGGPGVAARGSRGAVRAAAHRGCGTAAQPVRPRVRRHGRRSTRTRLPHRLCPRPGRARLPAEAPGGSAAGRRHETRACRARSKTRDDRAADERLLLHLALGAAADRVYLSYPRIELREARPRVPSFYGLDVMRAITGRVPSHEELQDAAARETRAALAWPAPEDSGAGRGRLRARPGGARHRCWRPAIRRR